MNNFKKDFPVFKTYPDLVYLDSAATSQKPIEVIRSVSDFYTRSNSNVHRGLYDLSAKATDIYENTRAGVASFIGSGNSSEIIFTGNASEAINLAAFGFARKHLRAGDIIVISEMEHHSNIVPWLRLKEEIGIKIFYLPVNNNYGLDYKKISDLPKGKIKLVSLTHASNVLGTVNPLAEIIAFLKKAGIKGKILIDAAQSVPHLPINVKELGCDFLAFSSHKMLGPSGVGVLWAKKEILEVMDPLFVGSHMISSVTKEKAAWAEIPDKFETGTGSLEAVAGLGAAINYLNRIGYPKIQSFEETLTGYALEKITRIPGLKLYGSKEILNRLGVFSFNLDRIHPHDVGEILNRRQICVRTGHHCAQPLMQKMGLPGTVRASLYLYNTKADIDALITGLADVKKIFTS